MSGGITLGAAASALSSSASTNAQVKVSEGQEDQQAKVVGKLIESVENTAPKAGAPGTNFLGTA